MKKSLICVKFDQTPAIMLEDDYKSLRPWFEENNIETNEWFNIIASTLVYGFNLTNEADYIATKLRWG